MKNPSSDSDLDLLETWQAGNRRAGARLFERHIDAIAQFFTRRVGHEAEDLTQRTFLACEESKEKIRGTSSFRTFLFGVARNVLHKHLRFKQRRERRMEQLPTLYAPDPSSSALMVLCEDHERLDEALLELSDEHQIVLKMYYWERRTSADVARELGVPHGTARTRIRRARMLLREHIDGEVTPSDSRRQSRRSPVPSASSSASLVAM